MPPTGTLSLGLGLGLLLSATAVDLARAQDDRWWGDVLDWTEFIWRANTDRAGTVLAEDENHFFGLFLSCHDGSPITVVVSLPYRYPEGYLPVVADAVYRSDWQVDDRPAHRIRLNAFYDDFEMAHSSLTAAYPLDGPLLQEMAAGEVLTITSKLVTWRFGLGGAAAALDSMRGHCGPR